ncbi:MAG: tripartite tricarboxylate transporter TctB family protein [Pseudonocardiaceae bacterium]
MSSLYTRLAGRSELGVALLLGAVGAVVAWDAARLDAPYSRSDPVGPTVVPYLVAALLLGCAAMLVRDVLKGGHGEAEGGEDVDLIHPSDWRTVLTLVAVFGVNVVLLDRVGWVISGTVLFWGSVWALGSRHYLRDGLISVVLSLVTFYGCYVGLGISLPAGLLEGVL